MCHKVWHKSVAQLACSIAILCRILGVFGISLGSERGRLYLGLGTRQGRQMRVLRLPFSPFVYITHLLTTECYISHDDTDITPLYYQTKGCYTSNDTDNRSHNINTCGQKNVDEKESIKYLGVLIDGTLSWKHHILNISKIISRAIGIMYKLRRFLHLKVMRNVYYSLVYSHIIYWIEAWGSAFKTELENILVLQKRAMSFNDAYPTVYSSLISSDSIFAKLETPKITDVYKYQVSKFIFKWNNKIAPTNFQNWFIINHARYGYHTSCQTST